MLNHGCSELIHRCANPSQSGREPDARRTSASTTSRARTRPTRSSSPRTCRRARRRSSRTRSSSGPTRSDSGRVLLFLTTPTSDSSTLPNLLVTDISRAREGEFQEIGTWKTVIGNPAARQPAALADRVERRPPRRISPTWAAASWWSTLSDFADERAEPAGPARHAGREPRLLDRSRARTARSSSRASPTRWSPTRSTASSAALLPAHGCPWGWVRIIDITRRDRSAPSPPSTACPRTSPEVCAVAAARPRPHRQLLGAQPDADAEPGVPHLARRRACRRSRPAHPTPARARPRSSSPSRSPVVQTEDPALSQGRDKVVMWSFPVIKDGLIYAVDIRNGLYILRYRGPVPAARSPGSSFLDGNSNSGRRRSGSGLGRARRWRSLGLRARGARTPIHHP